MPGKESIFAEGEIEKAIDSLEDEFRIPFRMHIEGYKYNEIADGLDLKIGTVKLTRSDCIASI